MKQNSYSSPEIDVFEIETASCLAASDTSTTTTGEPTTYKDDSTQVAKPVKKLKMGKVIVLAAQPKALFAKVKISIDGNVVEEITEKGKYVLTIDKDCTIDLKWNQAFSKKTVEAKANEIKVVKLTWGQMNINLEEIIYAKDGVKVFNDENNGSSDSGLRTGMKVAGVAIGIAAALLGGDADFDGFDLDGDLDLDDLDVDGDGIADALTDIGGSVDADPGIAEEGSEMLAGLTDGGVPDDTPAMNDQAIKDIEGKA